MRRKKESEKWNRRKETKKREAQVIYAYKNSEKSKKNSFFFKTRKKPGSGTLWGVVRGRFGLSNYVMTAVSAAPSTGLGKAVTSGHVWAH